MDVITLNPNSCQPLLDSRDLPELGGNINGPSLIAVPPWVENPLGKYYLYFAHHEGRSIRLAYADSLAGPWELHAPGALQLEHSGFAQQAPTAQDTDPTVLKSIAAGIDGDYPHIASPDVIIHSQTQKIWMYYHGRNPDGTQQTRLALSDDGLTFNVRSQLLGDSYFRVFQWQDAHYAIAWGSRLYRSTDGGYSFSPGHRLTEEAYRHGAIWENSGQVYILWSRAGDCPESLLISTLLHTDKDWEQWRLGKADLLRSPDHEWEGASLPLEASSYGGCMTDVNQIRDPAIFEENGKTYVLYSIRGEQGIAMGTLDN